MRNFFRQHFMHPVAQYLLFSMCLRIWAELLLTLLLSYNCDGCTIMLLKDCNVIVLFLSIPVSCLWFTGYDNLAVLFSREFLCSVDVFQEMQLAPYGNWFVLKDCLSCQWFPLVPKAIVTRRRLENRYSVAFQVWKKTGIFFAKQCLQQNQRSVNTIAYETMFTVSFIETSQDDLFFTLFSSWEHIIGSVCKTCIISLFL